MPKIAFLFSGQGAQYSGMMSDLITEIGSCKEVFDLADGILNRSISKLCAEGPQEALNLTHNTQPCTLTADLAALAAISDFGVKADAAAGFSLGEYAALVASGVMDIGDAFRIIQIRADAMQEAVPEGKGLMAAMIGSDPAAIEGLCEQVKSGYVVAANYNCPGQIVISGESVAVREAVSNAAEMGIRAVELPVSAPFHCALMAPAAEKLKSVLSAVDFKDPAIPVYMNVDGRALKRGSDAAKMLARQAMSPVRWQETIQNMRDDGIDTFIELGPGKTLSQFVKRTLKGVGIYRIESVKTLYDALDHIGA